jgi:hypothetical protein
MQDHACPDWHRHLCGWGKEQEVQQGSGGKVDVSP